MSQARIRKNVKVAFLTMALFALFLSLMNPGFYNVAGVNAKVYKYSLEAMETDGTWTPGDIKHYQEGQNIPTRLEIENLTVDEAHSIEIKHSYKLFGNDPVGILNFNRDALIFSDDGADNVILSLIGEVDCGADTCLEYNLSFIPKKTTATIYWNSLLGDDAADWPGARIKISLNDVGGRDIPVSPDPYIENPASITVHKDVVGPNGEDIYDVAQSFSIDLDGDMASLTDGGSHEYIRSAGTYTISETNIPSGYELYSISRDDDSGLPGYQITVGEGKSVDVDVVNRQTISAQAYGTLIVEKDVPNIENDPTKFDFSVSRLDQTSVDFQLSEIDNPYIADLPVGRYVIEEEAYPGYETSVTCEQDEQQMPNISDEYSVNMAALPDPNQEFVSLGAEEVIRCVFTNTKIETEQDAPVLYISKSNDAGSAFLDAGSDIKYSINISLIGNSLDNAVVTDLLPEGIKYRAGSFNAVSNQRGSLKDLGVVLEPTYASPGDWTIGSMAKDEVITLSYIGDVASDISDGIYKDVAFARGMNNQEPGEILALAQATGYVDTNFVGTEVNILAQVENDDSVPVAVSENTITNIIPGKVLGATTPETLPVTGADYRIIFVMISVISMAFALLFAIMPKKKIDSRKLLAVVAVGFGVLAFGGVASASSSLVIRLAEPQELIDSEFDLNFVALDTQGREVAISCYKKSPSDSSFVKFGEDVLLANGGNTDNCTVTKDVLTQDGVYNFQVKAIAGSDVVESDVVTTEFDNTNPLKPVSIEKIQKSDARYDIVFKTANDEETKSVKIYKSKSKSFAVDNETNVGAMDVEANTKYTYIDALKGNDYGETFYYAVMAFDKNGHASAPLAEELVVITNKEEMVSSSSDDSDTTSASTSSSTASAATQGSTSSISTESEGIVAGESTSSKLEQIAKSNSDESVKDDANTDNDGFDLRATAGAFGKIMKNLFTKWWFWLILVIVFVVLRRVLAKNRKNSKDNVA